MLVLNSVSDSYENLSVSIAPTVTKDGEECGVEITKSDMVAALEELLRRGWVKAYRLTSDGNPPVEFDHAPTVEEMEDFNGAWFDMTDAGRIIQQTWEFYPWDDDGELRKDWTPPLN
jgi:hypothetical protein